MKKLKKLLYTTNPYFISIATLILRVGVGGAMITHGAAKIAGFGTMIATFPDPIGFGSALSLILVIGAEFFCSILIMIGLFTRLATLPLIFTMGTAYFVVHANDAFATKELAFIYLLIYLAIFAMGAGIFSIDRLISNSIDRRA